MPEIIQKCEAFNNDEKNEISDVRNGYWFFLDRHSKVIDKYDYSEFLKRASSNYSIAVFDTDSNTLYYSAIDT